MNHRIEVTRTEPFAEPDPQLQMYRSLRGVRFVGRTDDGDEVAAYLEPEHWETLGRPESFVLRIRP